MPYLYAFLFELIFVFFIIKTEQLMRLLCVYFEKIDKLCLLLKVIIF